MDNDARDVVAIDLGGTSIKAARIDASGAVRAEVRRATPRGEAETTCSAGGEAAAEAVPAPVAINPTAPSRAGTRV